jgi:metabolite-proton symporter
VRQEATRTSASPAVNQPRAVNTPRQILFASLIGTAIEFFDFYIYATAAVLVFPALFFPASDPASATLASLATFGIAFVARPIGSAVFGHFGDRIGRKTTLVAALLTMGISTVAIGLLPSYQAIGIAAPALLALCRFGQGLGLGGEWGGAVLLATENAPPGRRAWYGMFPQLGAPVGFFLSGAVFLLLSRSLDDDRFFAWGWRVPFLASAVLVVLGLYVRLSISETPVFQRAMERHERIRVPMLALFAHHGRALVLGTLIGLSVYVIFYLMTVFTLSWATTALGYPREQFLLVQLFGVLFFGLTVPWSAVLADSGRRRMLIYVNLVMLAFGLVLARLFEAGTIGAVAATSLGMALMGLAYGPLGTVLAELFPTPVRYTGSSLTYNLAGIFGASLAPYAAMWLATNFGLSYVGYYLSLSTLLSLAGLWLSRETKDDSL